MKLSFVYFLLFWSSMIISSVESKDGTLLVKTKKGKSLLLKTSVGNSTANPAKDYQADDNSNADPNFSAESNSNPDPILTAESNSNPDPNTVADNSDDDSNDSRVPSRIVTDRPSR